MSAPYLVLFAPHSLRDVRELRRTLRLRAGTRIADRYADSILEFCYTLGPAPHRGETRAFLQNGLRVIGYKRRVAIYFRVSSEEQTVVIARILYAGKTR